MKVKAITSNDPHFLQTVYKYDDLIDLVNDEIYIKPHETYIIYKGRWLTYRMGTDRIPKRKGIYNNLFSAMFRAMTV